MIAGIILAAGASRRMGSPKALLEYRGETFLERQVRLLSGVCHPVIVVLGFHADKLRPRIGPDAIIALNPAPERGQLSSLQTGLAALPPEAEGFLFWPVDCPAVEPGTIHQIIQEFSERRSGNAHGAKLIVPQYRGKHGHPVCAGRELADEFLALPPSAQARDVVHAHVGETVYLDVEDPGILKDVDDPEAYREMVERAP